MAEPMTLPQATELVDLADKLHRAVSNAHLASDLLDHFPALTAAADAYADAASRIAADNTPYRVLTAEPAFADCRKAYDRHGRDWIVRFRSVAGGGREKYWMGPSPGWECLLWAELDAEHGPLTTKPAVQS